MLLDKIYDSKDLKKLETPDLNKLATEIRELILNVMSKKGGHLASSLGAVELCIAMHYTLNTPVDSLIFDVGHQTYAHKILTGRKDSFSKIREYKGLSGFPNPEESPYDLFITGHASTAVSYAQGLAEAKKIKNDTSKTIAVIGDGSLSGGMCFEALNNCGHSQSEVLVIFNHNEMSISPSVGALSKYLTKFVSDPAYNRIKYELEKFIENFSFMKKLSSQARKFEEAVKGLMVPGIFFEELGFRYFGPIDGHNLSILIPTLKNILPLKGPKLLHIITKKGKGYKFSEQDPEDFHGSVPFDIATGNALYEPKKTYGEVFAKKLVSLAEKNKKIVAVTAAMPTGTSLNIFGKIFPERLFDVGIAESHAVGFAAGLARAGLKPVVAIYSTFLQRAYDQIIHDVALQNLPVIFIIDRAGAVGEDGPTHHGVFDISFLRSIPNMICMSPKDELELEDMLEFAIEQNHPVSIRYPKGSVYTSTYKNNENIKLGKSQVLEAGSDVAIIALGSMVKEAIGVVSILSGKNIKATLINARFIKPLDRELLLELPEKFSHIVTLEESNLPGGFGSAILEFYENEKLSNKINILRIGFPDKFITFASREQLFSIYGLDAPSIAEKILENMGKSSAS